MRFGSSRTNRSPLGRLGVPWIRGFLPLLLAGCGGIDDAPTGPGGDDPGADVPAACTTRYCNPSLLSNLGFDPFYRKILDSGGIPILSSELVSDTALEAAHDIVTNMLEARPDLRSSLVARRARVGIMAPTEVTTDIPEHAFLANDPNIDWDQRARGLGGTLANPITTAGEENLLCLTGDVYGGESILVHEFAHGIHLLGINLVDPDFSQELLDTYSAALAEGLWADTYAATNEEEYWAEGVQSWFDSNQLPQPGIHNHVNSRGELLEHDPRLHALIARFFTDSNWRPLCV